MARRDITPGSRWRLAATACLLVAMAAGLARGEDIPGEPWSVTSSAPVIGADTEAAPLQPSAPDSLSSTVCFTWLAFYRQVLHVVVTSHCPMYPSCSNYSRLAIEKHGSVVGVILTADRLIHEGDEQYYAPVVQRNGRSLYRDPVENNDFWWCPR